MAKTIREVVIQFMGYCSVRYSTDQELAMSDEDLKQLDRCEAEIKALMDEEELFQLLAMSKSNFRNPNHYTLKEQEKMTRQDAKAIKQHLDSL